MAFLSPRAAPALLAHGSAALLLGALAFQHWGGLAPCVLCLWQRWPHVVAIAAGFVGMVLIRQGRQAPAGWATLVAALALAVTAGIGAYHAGATAAIFNDHLLAERLAQFLADGASDDVGAGAGRVGDDEANGFYRIALRVHRCRAQQQCTEGGEFAWHANQCAAPRVPRPP